MGHNDKSLLQTLELIERLREAGIGDSELEALAEGKAWVCEYEWVHEIKMPFPSSMMIGYYKDKYGDDCIATVFNRINPNTGFRSLNNTHFEDKKIYKVMTFNGSTDIPTPKEEE